MKWTTLWIVLVAFLATSCFSTRLDYGPQGEYSGKEWADRQTEWMESNLQLNRDQQRRIDDLNREYVQRIDQEFRAADTDFEKIQSVRRVDYEKEEQLKQILTVDQYRVYQENKRALYEFN